MTSSPTGHPSPGGSSSSGAFAFPALPVLSHRPETVVNPEGRRSEEETPRPPASQPASSVWQRLFPPSLGSTDENLGEPLPTPAGFELGHFVLQERIGIGGMGAVFRALDTRLQRLVALKVLGPAQSRDESSVKRFQNEASAAARLDHDNIARVYLHRRGPRAALYCLRIHHRHQSAGFDPRWRPDDPGGRGELHHPNRRGAQPHLCCGRGASRH